MVVMETNLSKKEYFYELISYKTNIYHIIKGKIRPFALRLDS